MAVECPTWVDSRWFPRGGGGLNTNEMGELRNIINRYRKKWEQAMGTLWVYEINGGTGLGGIKKEKYDAADGDY